MTYNFFAIKNIWEMNSLGSNAFHQCNVMKTVQGLF